jgi:hypothetical protein
MISGSYLSASLTGSVQIFQRGYSHRYQIASLESHPMLPQMPIMMVA